VATARSSRSKGPFRRLHPAARPETWYFGRRREPASRRSCQLLRKLAIEGPQRRATLIFGVGSEDQLFGQAQIDAVIGGLSWIERPRNGRPSQPPRGPVYGELPSIFWAREPRAGGEPGGLSLLHQPARRRWWRAAQAVIERFAISRSAIHREVFCRERRPVMNRTKGAAARRCRNGGWRHRRSANHDLRLEWASRIAALAGVWTTPSRRWSTGATDTPNDHLTDKDALLDRARGWKIGSPSLRFEGPVQRLHPHRHTHRRANQKRSGAASNAGLRVADVAGLEALAEELRRRFKPPIMPSSPYLRLEVVLSEALMKKRSLNWFDPSIAELRARRRRQGPQRGLAGKTAGRPRRLLDWFAEG